MPILDTTNWGVAASPEAEDRTKPPAKTGFIDGVKATWDQESIWTSSKVRSSIEYPNDPTFDYKSFDKSYWPLVAEARNREHAEDMVAQYEREQKNREIMENQSFALGLGTNLVVGLTNPANYLGVGRGATILGAAVKGAIGSAAGTAATEVVLQDRQLTRTTEESLYNIAGAATIGAPLGAAGKTIENRLVRGAWTANEPRPDILPGQTPVAEGVQGAYGADSISAARVAGANLGPERTLEGSQINTLLPFLPPAWNEKIARFSVFGNYGRSVNQRLSTSSFESSRNAHSVLLRSSLATADNEAGKANIVPIEVATGQRLGALVTRQTELDEGQRNLWWKRVENSEYSRDEILADLRAADPTLPADFAVNRTTFDTLVRMYMADTNSPAGRFPEVVERAQQAAKNFEEIDADKIDFGLYADKSQLIDISTGQRVLNPDETPDAIAIKDLQNRQADFERQITLLESTKAPDDSIEAYKTRLKEIKEEISTRRQAVEKYTDEYNALTPTSKTHRFAYEQGSLYLSRVFDKGRITGDREGFKQTLINGWLDKNPNLDIADPRTAFDLDAAANETINRLLNEQDVVSMADLKANLDNNGNYTKARVLNIDDRFLIPWMNNDVTSTQAYHASQAIVDIELAKRGVKFNEMIEDLNREAQKRIKEINEKHGVGTKKASDLISEVNDEKAKDIEALEFAMRRLKRKGPGGQDSFSKSANFWLGLGNKLAGMAQLGSSAFPNSLGDVASVSRALGTGRTLKLIGKMLSPEARADMKAHAKELGMLSELIDTQVRELTITDAMAGSMDPNKNFRSTRLQQFERGVDWTVDKFSKVSLIDAWARAGRMVASTASAQHILDAASKGWSSLSKTTRTDLAKFYIDESMLARIAEQAKKYGNDLNGVKFAELDKWDDIEAAEVFKSSVYAHTEAALNLPSIGTGNTFMTENFFGRMFFRFQSFNNAAYESTFLQSLQNRDVTRIATGAANYAFWGFASVYAYDALTGRDTEMNKYFGSPEAMQKTALKILVKGGFAAAPSDRVASGLKLLGDKKNPYGEDVKGLVPSGLADELFPKYDDVNVYEKMAGPTPAYIKKLLESGWSVLDGELDEKEIGQIRNLIPGQNIGWLRRGIDYLEEALGGRPADRNADK